MHQRVLQLQETLKRKSLFLFGPRQTGKTTYLQNHFPEALFIQLLNPSTYQMYLENPGSLESDLLLHFRKSKSPIVIIDEVQKWPQILDAVHEQIEKNKQLRFILTGSSARKLKRSGANLLGGRASWINMFPLCYPEIKDQLITVQDLEKRILLGGLPAFFDSTSFYADWQDYVNLYLNEEIKQEGLVRNHEAFHRFLLVAGLTNSQQVNFTQLGSDTQVPPRTVHDYFQILQDTLVGYLLKPYTQTVTRKAQASSKFYLFDTGLTNALCKRQSLAAKTSEFGPLFEQFVIGEVKAYIGYNNKDCEIFYWRSQSRFEVDLIVQTNKEIWAVEIKSKNAYDKDDLKGLKAFAEDKPECKKILILLQCRQHIVDKDIDVVSVFDFLPQLWQGQYW